MKKWILRRRPSSEEHVIGGNVHLWYQDSRADFIISLVGQKGNVQTRITYPNYASEIIGHPFAETYWTAKKNSPELTRWKNAIQRFIKNKGIQVKLK